MRKTRNGDLLVELTKGAKATAATSFIRAKLAEKMSGSVVTRLHHSAEYVKFFDKSNFTNRRTNQFWFGNFTDMTIEQTQMRSMKTIGDLTHGRGIIDSTLTIWVQDLPSAHDVCETLKKYCGVYMANSEQHVDSRPSRISRDESDLKKLLECTIRLIHLFRQ